MTRRTTGILVLLLLVAFVPSCTRLSKPDGAGGDLAIEQVPASGVIPQEWGALISVSSVADFPHAAQLWFQDREGNVRIVVLDLSTHQFVNARLIRRK